MKLGDIEIHPLETGIFRLDGGAMFGVVPKQLWSRTNPPDEQNRILMALRVLLVRSGGKIILVDTGAGGKNPEKFRAIYAISFDTFSLDAGLASMGIRNEDVTDVILTHLHFDHAGGATAKTDRGLEPVFPNAVHHLQRAHWDWAMKPSERDRASFLPENYMPLQERGLMNLIDGAATIADGVTVLPVNGHTPGQQLVRIAGGGRSILFCGDLVPMSAHVPAPYIMGYDLQPLVTLQEKHDILGAAAASGEILVFEHDPFVEAALVIRDAKGFRILRSGTLEELLGGHATGDEPSGMV
jgi:glyoxylase-like metal-dependent hydrolase (beta-lactamase superfamily II)